MQRSWLHLRSATTANCCQWCAGSSRSSSTQQEHHLAARSRPAATGSSSMSQPSSGSRRTRLRACAVTALVCLFLGLLVLVMGWIVPWRVSQALQDGVLENIIWTPRSPPEVDARFRNNSGPHAPPDVMRFWLFNISNLDDVRQGAKPVLEQVGPYVHRAFHEKHDVMWSADGRVHFKDYTYFVLDEAATTANLSAPIATLNLALLGVLANLHGALSPHLVPFADVLMQAIASYQGEPNMHGLFTVRPAMELLWGYTDPLLLLLQPLLPPSALPDGPRVALMQNTSSLAEARARNASIFNTGELDLNRIWNEEEDRGRTAITSWPCPEFVRGSDASQFKPGLTPRDALTIFVADIAQPLRLVVNSTVELDGVELLRYWLDPAQLAPNACHNVELHGLMNITTPHAVGFAGPSNGTGPPIFVSMPMFCGADERLAAALEGVDCDYGRHMTWVDVEPITGITMRAYKRLMMSSQVAGLGSVLDPHVPGNLTIPMFWAEEAAAAPPDVTAAFKASVYRAVWVTRHLRHACLLGGGGLLLLGVIMAALTADLATGPGAGAAHGQGSGDGQQQQQQQGRRDGGAYGGSAPGTSDADDAAEQARRLLEEGGGGVAAAVADVPAGREQGQQEIGVGG